MNHADRKVFLHPGDFCFTKQGTHIHTLLGSCISITLWHPHLHIGGMCHFTLPEYLGEPMENRNLDGRYARDVIKMFRREAIKHKTKLPEYEAKIFGGGNMIKSEHRNIEDAVGTKNSSAAMKLLMQEKVKILVAHVGEFGHRRLVFDVNTGEVWVRHVDNSGARVPGISGKT